METVMFTFHKFAGYKNYLTKEDLWQLMEKEVLGYVENQKGPMATGSWRTWDGKMSFEKYFSLFAGLTNGCNECYIKKMKAAEKNYWEGEMQFSIIQRTDPTVWHHQAYKAMPVTPREPTYPSRANPSRLKSTPLWLKWTTAGCRRITTPLSLLPFPPKCLSPQNHSPLRSQKTKYRLAITISAEIKHFWSIGLCWKKYHNKLIKKHQMCST